MKVGTRITAATSALVVVTLGIYVFLDLRSAAAERRVVVERQAREVAVTLRAGLEARGVEVALQSAEELGRQITRAGTPWRVALLSRGLLKEPAEPSRRAQLKRLKTVIDVPELHLASQDGDTFIYTVALRVPSLSSPDGFSVAGALELTRSVGFLKQALRSDLYQTLTILAVMLILTVLAVTWLTRTLMTAPVEKLLAGIDDVAQGDLSRVLLSERDDEIGALATRFNEMTFSLRESRAETQRQNEAKLKLEQRLAQTEKLATIGQLAAELAHEVGTPLNVIAVRASSLKKKSRDPEAVSKNARIIAEQSARITRIIQRLLDFTRRKVGVLEQNPVQLNEVTLSTMELLEAQFTASSIKSTLARAEGLPPIPGDADRLQQVLLNLILNAVQAMPAGGTLRVETAEVHRRRPGLDKAPEQTCVVVEVADTGVGIPAEHRDKIFEPFYTSKSETGGTGLGLSVCFGIVKEHDGWIELSDVPGGGTAFRVYLPTSEAKSDKA